MTYGALYLEARKQLSQTEDLQTASMMARHLLAKVTGKRPETILADRNALAAEQEEIQMHSDVARIIRGEPFAYVLGEWEFYGLPLYVSQDVLIPRDDTCAVAALAIQQGIFLDKDPRVLDLCCGSGCIGLAVANRVKDCRVTLADLSKEALQIAKKNIALHKVGGRVSCIQVDAMQEAPAFLGKFDLIVSNPPYVTAQEMQELPESVKAYEPHMALFGGEDGLDFYRAIVKNYTSALKTGGFLCFEFGMGQGDAVCAILEESGYTILERTRDYNDRERAVLAQFGRKGF